MLKHEGYLRHIPLQIVVVEALKVIILHSLNDIPPNPASAGRRGSFWEHCWSRGGGGWRSGA